ncbi:unnamed protein product [Sphagnum balticum]
MLRCYDLSGEMSEGVLKQALKKIVAVEREMNALDLADVISIYLKYEYLPEKLEALLDRSYNNLKRNVNDQCLAKIWPHIPRSLTSGKLKRNFV